MVTTSRSVLSLGLASVGEPPVAAPIRVCFAVCSNQHEAPTTFSPSDSCWEERESDFDYRRTNDLLNRLQEVRVAGKTLLEFVRCENVSMWQFLPSYVWPTFFLAVEMIDLLGRIVDDVRPQVIRVFSANHYPAPLWREAVQAVGECYGVPVFTVDPVHVPISIHDLQQHIVNSLRRVGVGELVLWVRRMLYQTTNMLSIRVRFSKDMPKGLSNAHSSCRKLLLVTLGRRHWVPDPLDPSRKYDEQMFPLLPALQRAGWSNFVAIDCENSSVRELQRRMREEEPDVPWRAFSSYRRQRDSTKKRTKLIFARMWQLLQQDHEFLEDFRYRGVQLMPVLREELRRAFLEILPECAEMLATAARILKEEHPDAVIATYETGPWARALIIQAARASIPTLGLQHGMIFDTHYDYMHRHITCDPTVNPSGFVVPEVTCVWGSFWKQVLTRAGSYPPGAVVVTGNWRYDRIAGMARAIDINKIKSSFGIVPENKVVLILSSGQSVVDYVRQCLQVLGTRSELTPLIKLHSVDDPKPVREMLQEMGYPDDVLVEERLIEAMMAADLVISQTSTAVGEAALLDRPVVLVNFLKLSNIGAEAYVESGICLYATNLQELTTAVEKALVDPLAVAQMSRARTGFISRYFFKIDGCAAQRVAEALETRSLTRQSLHDVAKPR